MPITKYMSLSHFEDLVNNGLYISCASGFDDWWEATLAYCDDDGTPRADDNFEMLKTHLDWIYVSCWIMRQTESYPMWRLYGGWSEKDPTDHPAVAITLDLDDLVRCFNRHHSDKYAKQCRVSYQKPGTRELMSSKGLGKGGTHPDPQINMTMMFLTQKHVSYDFEDEYRIICCPDNIPAQRTKSNLKLPNEQTSIRLPLHEESISCTITSSPNMTETDFHKLNDLCSQTAWEVSIQRSEIEIPYSWKK
jgi:hypothetical protein